MQLILLLVKPCCPIGLTDPFLPKNRTWNGPGLLALFLTGGCLVFLAEGSWGVGVGTALALSCFVIFFKCNKEIPILYSS